MTARTVYVTLTVIVVLFVGLTALSYVLWQAGGTTKPQPVERTR
jgi:hypothetical protein